MTIQNLTTYDEEDAGNYIRSITATQCWIRQLPGIADSHLSYDFGVDFFDGDFEHWVEFYVDSASSYPNTGCYGVTNGISGSPASQDDVDADGGDYLSVRIKRAHPFFKIYACINGSLWTSSDTASLSQDTWYWHEFERKDSVGTYGTMYLRIYSDAEKTTLETSVSRTIPQAKEDFRFHMAVFGVNNDDTTNYTGYHRDFDLNIPVPASLPIRRNPMRTHLTR